MRKISIAAILLSIILFGSFTLRMKTRKSPIPNIAQPDPGLTNSGGVYCTDCHGNPGNGSVQIVGIPTSITPNTAYNFSVVISHTISGTQVARTRWGFAINARNATNTADVGTFSTTNPNATVNASNELTHLNAPIVPAAATYTYANLKWTSPASISGLVTFYVAGLAANGTGTTGGDFSYANTLAVGTLPVKMGAINAKIIKNNQVEISWSTLSETNVRFFDVEESTDGANFKKIGTLNAVGTSVIAQSYNFVQAKPAAYNKHIFYRVKVVDFDGAFMYSQLTSVRLEATTDFVENVTPTFIGGEKRTNINIVSSKDQHASIQVVNLLGQKMQTQESTLAAGSNKIELNARQLNSGKYFLIVQFGNVSQTISIMVE